MIEIKKLTKKFIAGKEEFFALRGVSLSIDDGEFLAVCGKSGSGKSTLLNILGTLDNASGGIVKIDGVDISSLKQRELAAFRSERTGFIFQSFYLEPGYSVYDNVELPLLLSGSAGGKNKKKVEVALESVGLASKIKSRAGNLSGGEQQRVAIARAIINDPKYIFADEPCGNLDTLNSENIMNILRSLNDAGKTVIMVTHDEEDAHKAKRIVTMSDGRIIPEREETMRLAV